MGNWYVNPGLKPLVDVMRSKGIVVGTIGDAAHQNEISDHNPNAAGRVNAADFMIKAGVFTATNAQKFADAVVKDSRVKYVIWNHHIWQNGAWHPYSGSDPHTGHVHVSVFDSAKDNISPWKLEPRKVVSVEFTVSVPLLKEGDSDNDFDGYDMISRMQKQVGVTPDGDWGPKTTNALGFNIVNEDRYRALFGLTRVPVVE